MNINKKKGGKIILRAAVCAILTGVVLSSPGPAGGSLSSAADVRDSNVQSMENEIQNLKNQQTQLEQQINDVRNKSAEAAKYKQYMDSLVTATQQKMVLSEALIEELEVKISESETQIAETESAIAETYEKLKERLRYSQENGTVTEIELLLDARGLSDFLTRLDKVGAMMDYDKRIMAEYEEKKESLNEYKASLEASKQTQTETLAELETDRANYQAISNENAQYMQSLQNDEAAFEAEYEKVRQAEEALNAELAAYIKKMQEQSQVVPSGSGFMRPLPAGVGYISSHFGWRTLGGRNDYHQATDMPCASGTPILASDSGKVIRAASHWSYGNYILIDHGGGLSSLYAHCSALAVREGDTVERGQTIGYVGETGYAFGSHLHFEIRVNGERVDPEGYVALG